MMTAIFFLNLRKWEETGNNGTSAPAPTETLQFAPGRSGRLHSMFDDFGEDPVYVARSNVTHEAT